MNRLSNRGQSLALFVIFIPVIIMIGTFIIDLGLAKYNDNKLENINKMIIKYGLKNIDKSPYDTMVELISKNDEDIDNYNIDIDNEKKEIKMSLEKSTNGVFGSIAGKKIYKEKSSYYGHIEDGKIIIERDDDE